MTNVTVHGDVPPGSLVSIAFPRLDYVDRFAIRVPRGTFESVNTFASACASLPGWVAGLMRLRDRLAAPFGLKTVPPDAWQAPTTGAGQHYVAGNTVGIFRILDRTEGELLVGEDDRHLDFRLSFVLEEDSVDEVAHATTVVRFKSAFGRFYFALVRPFHGLIVRSMLRAAVSSRNR